MGTLRAAARWAIPKSVYSFFAAFICLYAFLYLIMPAKEFDYLWFAFFAAGGAFWITLIFFAVVTIYRYARSPSKIGKQSDDILQ